MIFRPAYFPNIETFSEMIKSKHIILETNDFFEKQTYRTRCHIYSPNGLLMMNIPIKHQKKEHQFTKDVLLENDFAWQKNHFKTIQNSYRSSPYFEYYEDEIENLYRVKEQFLLDFILKSIELSYKLLQIPFDYQNTETFEKLLPNDFRYLIDAKKESTAHFKPYTQVFHVKNGFIPNLSILDLLFSEGPNSANHLIA